MLILQENILHDDSTETHDDNTETRDDNTETEKVEPQQTEEVFEEEVGTENEIAINDSMPPTDTIHTVLENKDGEGMTEGEKCSNSSDVEYCALSPV